MPFYDFDQVDYYSINISTQDISDIEYQRKKNSFEYKKISKKDALFLSLLRNKYPETIEENFPEKLIKYDFKKTDIDKKLYPEINTIFSEKPCNDNLGSFCIPTFRDIFIFRKKDRISKLENGNKAVLEDLWIWFAPTCQWDPIMEELLRLRKELEKTKL